VNEALLEVEPAGAQGVEALKTARAAAAQRFAEQDASKGISAAIDDVAPDRFVQKFIIGAPAREMKATLAELGKSRAGKQAVVRRQGPRPRLPAPEGDRGVEPRRRRRQGLQRAALREGAGRDRAGEAARALQPDGGRVAAQRCRRPRSSSPRKCRSLT
jgi:hypothetical protein